MSSDKELDLLRKENELLRREQYKDELKSENEKLGKKYGDRIHTLRDPHAAELMRAAGVTVVPPRTRES